MRTPSGQGPASARWQGKLLAPTSETFTLFVRAEGGVRLFIDHRVVIDAWAGDMYLFPPCLWVLLSEGRG